MKLIGNACLIALSAFAFTASAGEFSLRSPTLHPGEKMAEAHVFKGFGCDGGNLSPALEWTGAPTGTRSFAVTVYDPDAPTGSGWWHWVVYNIPATTTQLAAGAGSADGRSLAPGAVQGRTDFGAPGYGGACPPAGDTPHRYLFTVHALKVERLDLPPDASAAMVGFMINANRLDSAILQVSYSR